MKRIDPNTMNDRDLINFFQSDNPVAKAAKIFRHRSANIEQKLAQRKALSPIDMVRLEIEAAQDIAEAINKNTSSSAQKSTPNLKITINGVSLREERIIEPRGQEFHPVDNSSIAYDTELKDDWFLVGIDISTQQLSYIPYAIIGKMETVRHEEALENHSGV